GAGLAVRLRVPAGALLVPMIAAALLQGAGWLTVTVPRAVLMIGYGAIGLSIGLRFRRELLRRTLRAIPEMLASAVALIGLCGVSAWVLILLSQKIAVRMRCEDGREEIRCAADGWWQWRSCPVGAVKRVLRPMSRS
ncbi:MAG TPA: AbrB family transcriptional regulator, partial [Novosphingobium sp.]|nr:AbrB family transcriptional regulator [Novosphingobium sp.]